MATLSTLAIPTTAIHSLRAHHAKALHYREIESHSYPAATIEALISINTQLQQPEAAKGILVHARQHHQACSLWLHPPWTHSPWPYPPWPYPSWLYPPWLHSPWLSSYHGSALTMALLL